MMNDGLIWDAHACLPLHVNQDMAALERHRAAGVDYVSINVGMDFNPVAQVVHVLAGFRAWLRRHEDRFVLARSIADIRAAKAAGKLAVGFDLEGSAMLEDDLSMLALYRDLGVRQMHLAYNRDNSIAGGCHGAGTGLTALGRQVVAEINRVGIIMDCSHSSVRTSLDVMEVSTRPVVFSHANVQRLSAHVRNLTDEQIDACARTDGVIGVSGISLFLGTEHTRGASLIPHIDYIAQRVGARHVGLGLDYVFDKTGDDHPPGFNADLWWPADQYRGGYRNVPPECFGEIAEALTTRGYSDCDLRGILGENFARVAAASWRE